MQPEEARVHQDPRTAPYNIILLNHTRYFGTQIVHMGSKLSAQDLKAKLRVSSAALEVEAADIYRFYRLLGSRNL